MNGDPPRPVAGLTAHPRSLAVPVGRLRPASCAVLALVCALVMLLAGCSPESDSQAIRSMVTAVHESAEGVPVEQLEARQERDIALLEWAVELELVEPLGESELRRAHQAAVRELGEDRPYGVTDLSFWDYYQEWVEGSRERLRSHLRDSLSIEEVREYYDANPEQFARQDTITVEAVPWSDGRAGTAFTLTIDEASVRGLQEQHDELVAAALRLQPGELATVDLGQGEFIQVKCLERVDGGQLPFDDVVQAALSQLATERVDSEIQRRADLQS